MKINKYIEIHKKIAKLEEQIGNIFNFESWLHCLHSHYNPPIMSFWKEKEYCFYDEFIVNSCPFRFFDGTSTYPMNSTLRTTEWKEYKRNPYEG